MINFKINDLSIPIPTDWPDVKFKQYLEIFNLKDDVLQLVSIISGQDYEYLKSATIIGLDRLLQAISFINIPPVIPPYPPTCGPYSLPANSKGQFNIQYESLGQFEDARQAMNKTTGNLYEHTKAYGKYVAIYLQKIRDGKYDPLKVPDMEAGVQNFPALEVISLGQFFFLKLKSSLNGTVKTSLPITPPQKKSKRAGRNSKRSSRATRKSTR
jgi:hypothetical protein